MSIVENKKAFFDYFIEDRWEAGLVLEGWEVKAIRSGRGNIKEAYVVVRQAELYLIGCHISPLPEASPIFTPIRSELENSFFIPKKYINSLVKQSNVATPSSL